MFEATANKFFVVLLLINIFFIRFEAKAQHESDKWVFGYGAGLDFSTGKPVSFSGSCLKTAEGCSCVSDKAGNLLFYTDGISIWNKNHQLMPNGTNLSGDFSSTQSAIIVPMPGDNTLYYVFTMDKEAGKGGFCYSIVDISKENGLGDVTVKKHLIKQNCTEKLLALRHTNGKDIWVITHEFGSNAFLAYLLTKDGLAPAPVISTTGIPHSQSIYNAIGYIKVSPHRKKLAVAITGEKMVQVFDFDSETGTVSNPVDLKFKRELSPYGLEFSPNNTLLYISSATKGQIYQANLNAGKPSDIEKSLCLIGHNESKKGFGAMQLGIDSKIYIAEYESKFLSTIENPNGTGTTCSFKADAVPLGSNTSMLGLPTFFHEYVKHHYFKQVPQAFNRNKEIELNKSYYFDNVYFDLDKTHIKSSSANDLKTLASFLKLNPQVNIQLTGHTDSTGLQEYNDKLSLTRAKETAELLIKNGIDSYRITYLGKGSKEPLAPNSDKKGRKQNRRVEFVLTESKN